MYENITYYISVYNKGVALIYLCAFCHRITVRISNMEGWIVPHKVSPVLTNDEGDTANTGRKRSADCILQVCLRVQRV